MEYDEGDSSASTADMEDHVELDTDNGSASIGDMTDIEHLYTDHDSPSMDNMVDHHSELDYNIDDMVEHYLDYDYDTMMEHRTEHYLDYDYDYDTMMEHRTEHYLDYDHDTMMEHRTEHYLDYDIDTMVEPSFNTTLHKTDGATMRVLTHMIIYIELVLWNNKSVPAMIAIDTLLRAQEGTTSKVPSYMNHHLGMLRIVIDTRHLKIVVDHHHLMIAIDMRHHMIIADTSHLIFAIDMRHHMIIADTSHLMFAINQHLPRIFDDTPQDMCNTPQAHKLYFAQLDAQFANKTLQDTIIFKEWCKEMDKMTTMKPTLQDGVEKVEHGMIPSTKVANGVENGSMEDEFPIMEKMYMVHEDDDITPCLQEVKDVDHMDPTTSTTPTSNESDYKGLLTSEGTFKRWCHLPPLHIHEELSSRTTLFQVGGDDAARPSVYTASYTSSPREDAMETRGRKADVTEAWKRRRKRSWTLQAGTSAPDGRNFRPTGTSAPKGRNFRPMPPRCLPAPREMDQAGTSAPRDRNFRPPGTSAVPPVPKVRQNAPGCYCKETGHIRN
ncbi:hypothetical protein QYE76_052472 [Lolium multiflorum]|uniref:Uncharacterized protein n=1 Tax=Lolium multiflorum TaxID=4521 RepID=A0AAD8WL30_LOLMU|nr:hypothetical protein QYE76_052472 [Lolium multiflorum]